MQDEGGPQLVPAAPSSYALDEAPEELRGTRLRRLGEGIGKVVYASPHWVVQRERSPSEIIALIVLWKLLRRMERWLPGRCAQRLLERPSNQIRALRVSVQASMAFLPRGLWMSANIRKVLLRYLRDRLRGEKLAQAYLSGSDLVPLRISFPPTRVAVAGWPGWLVVSEAAERVECTLYQRLAALAAERRYAEVEEWLLRFLDLRQRGWQRGVFSLDAHLKNFGVSGNRVVLLDTGGLTNRLSDVERKLAAEDSEVAPHVRLGLAAILAECPEVAARFDQQWKRVVTPDVVQRLWMAASPAPAATAAAGGARPALGSSHT